MILRLNNKSKNFYAHLGKVFGSREVEKLTYDRIYDDDDKDWYIYYDRGKPSTFVSVVDGVIKNVWSENKKHLVKVLRKVSEDISVKTSVVTMYFQDEYKEAGYIIESQSKNFIKIKIRGDKNEKG